MITREVTDERIKTTIRDMIKNGESPNVMRICKGVHGLSLRTVYLRVKHMIEDGDIVYDLKIVNGRVVKVLRVPEVVP